MIRRSHLEHDQSPLNENELQGSRQKHDRLLYGSARPPLEYPLRDTIRFNGSRTDDQIEEDVCNVLLHDQNLDARNIEVHVRDGIVTLSGTVESRMEKIEAEMAIEAITGVEDILNQLQLKKREA